MIMNYNGYETSVQAEDRALEEYCASNAVNSEVREAIATREELSEYYSRFNEPNPHTKVRAKVSSQVVFLAVVAVAFFALIAYNVLTYGTATM